MVAINTTIIHRVGRNEKTGNMDLRMRGVIWTGATFAEVGMVRIVSVEGDRRTGQRVCERAAVVFVVVFVTL